jgi:site-specific recombinase XerD
MVDPSRIRITGPLEPHVGLVWSGLLAQGYTPLSSRNLLHLMSHLSRWLEVRALQAHDLTNARIEEFLDGRRQAGLTVYISARGLEPILGHLRTAGVVAPAEQAGPPATELDRLFRDYGQYLLQERALVPTTIRHYQSVARSFLSDLSEQGTLQLSRLRAGDVASFVVNQSRTSSVAWAKYTVTVLRSLLRFLFLRGDLTTDLVGAVPGVAGWRQASLPKALPPQPVRPTGFRRT